jgi:hypothetical protein
LCGVTGPFLASLPAYAVAILTAVSVAAAPIAQAQDAPARLPAATPNVVDLRFGEFFVMPIGPRGLVPTPRLLALDGQRVRLVGYMSHTETPTPGTFILAPLPITLGNEDEALADDLPATAVHVHLHAANRAAQVDYRPGLVALIGTLALGSAPEADGRMSFVRLELDAETSARVTPAP